MVSLYPGVPARRIGRLPVDERHSLYWEEAGAPDGIPVLFLHGGPGAGAAPVHRRFFDPTRYRIVIHDQRGAGRSEPLGALEDNTTADLVADIERLRELLGIEQWLVFGGSWGSTLALAYGEAHPERCLGFVLRGIFLGSDDEIDWFMRGMGRFFPEAGEAFVSVLPPESRADPLLPLHGLLTGDDAAARHAAGRAWATYERACSMLIPPSGDSEEYADAQAIALARIEAHYFVNHLFLEPGQLLDGLGRIRHLPATIVQGRYDLVCPPEAAWRLSRAWPGARLHVVPDAGHGALEPGIRSALVEATDRFRDEAG